jgi:hypothetical protein
LADPRGRLLNLLMMVQMAGSFRMGIVAPILALLIRRHGVSIIEIGVLGVAITTEATVPGCATGASHPNDIEEATRFCVEVTKAYGKGLCQFYNAEEWRLIEKKYGSLKLLQTLGRA